ncbi:MAG: hypothetical protein M3Q58_14595 [Bacteroidota bacterium]|nr:hypothetical protein [Bacteroidota bacterium]
MEDNFILNSIKESCISSKIDEPESRKNSYQLILKIIQPNIDKFNESIIECNKNRESYTKTLFSNEFEELKNKDKLEFLNELLPIYKHFIFFPSKEIIDRFKYLGIQREALKWFVDIDLIKEQIVKINSSNELIIYPYDSLTKIKDHIYFNGLNQILLSYNLVSEKRKEGLHTNILHNQAYDISRRKENPPQNITDAESLVTICFQNSYKILECVTGESKSAKKLPQQILLGKTKKFLRQVLIDHAYFFTEKKQYHHLYELCRLIFPYKNLWKTEEFDERNNLKGTYYNLKQYQNKMVIKCLGNQTAFPNIVSDEMFKEKLLDYQNSAYVTFRSIMKK